jgi:hypothetical protein
MTGEAAVGPVTEAWRTSVAGLWDEWVLAEIAAELALFLWRTAEVEDRADAYQEYVRALRHETRIAGLLARTRQSDDGTLAPPLRWHRDRPFQETT